MGSSPLRRSDRGKRLVKLADLENIKSTKGKAANNSKQSSEETVKQDSNGGGRKRKSLTAVRYKALFKPQRRRVDSDDKEDLEVEGKSPQAITSRKEDVDTEPKVQNSIRVQEAPDKHLLQIEHDGCPQIKPLDVKSIESIDFEKKISGIVSPSHGNVANTAPEAVKLEIEKRQNIPNENVSRKGEDAFESINRGRKEQRGSLEIEIRLHIPNENVSRKGEDAFENIDRESDEQRASLDIEMCQHFPNETVSMKGEHTLENINRESDEQRASLEIEKRQHIPSENFSRKEEDAIEYINRESGEHRASLEIEMCQHIPSENVSMKGESALETIKRERDEQRASLENEYKVDKAFIRVLYSKPSITRSNKLELLEREFAKKLEEHEIFWQATMLTVEGQVAPSGDPEVAPTLPEKPIEVQSLDEPVCEGANDIVSTGSHASEKAMLDATVSSEQIGEVPAQQLGDDMEVDLAEKVDSSPLASHAMEDHNEIGANAMVDATVSSEQIGEVPAQQLGDDMEVDVAEKVDSGLVASHAMEDHNETGANAMFDATVSSEQIGEVPAQQLGDDMEVNLAEKVDSGRVASHAMEDHNEIGANAMFDATVSSEKIGEVPAQQLGDDMKVNLAEKVDSGRVASHAMENHNEIGANAMFDATVSSEQIGEVPAQQLGDDLEVDLAEKVDSSPVASYAAGDHNETGATDMAPHVNCGDVEMPAGTYNKENDEAGTLNLDTLHVEDCHETIVDVAVKVEYAEMGTPAGTCDKENAAGGEINPVCAVNSQDKTPSVEPASSPASDHLEPIIPKIQNEPLQLQPPNSGIQVKETNDGNLQPSGANQLDQIIPADEPDFPSSTDQTVTENPSDTLPPNGPLLEPACEEPTHTVQQSGENLEVNLVPAAETPQEEHEAQLATSVAPALPVNALNMFDNLVYQMSSQTPTNPLQAEEERLYTVKDNVTKFYQEWKQNLKSECKKEIAEIIAQISLKYKAKLVEADAAFNLKKKELETNINRVTMNRMLAEAFISSCQDPTPPGHPASQAGLMQHLNMLSVSPSMRPLHGFPLSSSPGQSSGSKQPPQPSPPLPRPQLRPALQIVHQPAALFSCRPRLRNTTSFGNK